MQNYAVLDLSPEVERLRPAIGDARADALLARERREVFSVYPEVRVAAWAGALLIALAVGLFVKEHFQLFDRRLIAIALALLAAGCYWWSWRRRPDPSTDASHDTRKTRVAADYVLLLGALILSADVAFVEEQFDVFGAAGQRHFLVLALLHAIAAYAYASRQVLSLSVAALAAWMGLEQRTVFELDAGLAARAFLCAGVVLVWRYVDRRARPESEFSRVFEHFAANLALWGGLALADEHPGLACLLTLAVAAVVIAWGFHSSSFSPPRGERARVRDSSGESFVLYAFVYAVIATDIWLARHVGDVAEIVFLSMVVAVPALFLIHRQFRRRTA